MTFADVRTRSLALPLIAFTALISLGITLAGQAQTSANTQQDARIGSLIETLGKTKTPSSAAISPDGSTVAWAVRTLGGSQIHLTDVANPDPAKEVIVGTGSSTSSCEIGRAHV